MKKTIILLAIIGLNTLSASAITAEKKSTENRIINILIKHDLVVEREARENREARMGRKSREVRMSRTNRVVRMGRNSRGIRPERTVRVIYKTPKSINTHLSATNLIQKSYLSKLSK